MRGVSRIEDEPDEDIPWNSDDEKDNKVLTGGREDSDDSLFAYPLDGAEVVGEAYAKATGFDTLSTSVVSTRQRGKKTMKSTGIEHRIISTRVNSNRCLRLSVSFCLSHGKKKELTK